MAVAPVITGAPTRAPTNVTRLPTAASPKVQQPSGRGARRLLAKLPQHPAERLFAGQRRALRRAERLVMIERTPALMIAGAIYAALDQETRSRVMLSLAPGIAQEEGPCRDAVEMLLSSTMTIGEQVDMDWAMRRLSGEGR